MEDNTSHAYMTESHNNHTLSANVTAQDHAELDQLQRHAYSIALPIVLLLGVVGNALNIMVLTRSRFRHSLHENEKCACALMLAMAVSDLAFCLVGLPGPLLSVSTEKGASTLQVTALYYATYHTPLSDMFIFCTTWLVAVVALERYQAVCHPFNRGPRHLRNTIFAIVVIFFVSILFNLPGFLKYEVRYHACPDTGRHCYYVVLTSLYMSTAFRRIYRGLWLAVGALLPLVVMATCNTHLLLAIYRSKTRHNPNGESRYCMSQITLILVSIVTLFLVLVFPATLLGFIGDMVLPHAVTQFYSYQVAIVIFNLTQAVYFAMHFALYCSVSRAFRDSLACRHQHNPQPTHRHQYRAVVFNRV